MASVVSLKTQAGPVPSAEELVDRARAMIPTLKSRARQCVKNFNVSVFQFFSI